MKSGLIIFLSALLLCLAGCKTTPDATAGTPATGADIVYKTYGMDCPGCHGGLEKNLEKIPGVTDAVANWKEQTVQIFLAGEGQVAEEDIARAVAESNFTLGERIQ